MLRPSLQGCIYGVPVNDKPAAGSFEGNHRAEMFEPSICCKVPAYAGMTEIRAVGARYLLTQVQRLGGWGVEQQHYGAGIAAGSVHRTRGAYDELPRLVGFFLVVETALEYVDLFHFVVGMQV